MNSVRFAGQGKIEIVDVPRPVPGPGEALVKTVVSAICGSELGCYRNAGMAGNGGHEAAGIIAELGDGVFNLAIGDRVGVSAISGCGHCEYCEKQQYTWCNNKAFHGNMHAEYFLAAANGCHILSPDIDWNTGVLISGDGMGVPYHTSTKIIAPDARVVAVFGAGPIGLGNTMLERYLGRKVIVVDISETRLKFAERFGAVLTLNPTKCNAVEEIKKYTSGKGADFCIEAAGIKATALNCFDAVKTGGQVIFNGEQGEVPFSISDHFIRRDITATGSWFYHFSEYRNMLEMYRHGFKVQDLISDEFPFEKSDEAYALFAAGESAKVILKYS